MQFLILSLRDIKADLFHPPIYSANLMVTLRDIGDHIQAGTAQEHWVKHPQDFELYQLGTWDSATGETVSEKRQITALSSLAIAKQ